MISRSLKPKEIICPDFFIAGFHKCATFSMYHNLNQHPEINMGQFKEPLTFARDYHWGDVDNVYRKHYLPGSGRILGDSNVYNSVVKYVPDRIKLCNESPKVLFMVRNPIERIYTQWRHLCRLRPGTEINDFPTVIQRSQAEFKLDRFAYERDYVPTMCRRWNNYYRMYLEIGCYYHYIMHWFEKFDDVKVISFHDYISSPNDTLADVFNWLGVRPIGIKVEDRNMDDWHDLVWKEDPKVIDWLCEFYEPWNSKLEDVWGIKFPSRC